MTPRLLTTAALVLLAACNGSTAPVTQHVPVDVALSPDGARYGGQSYSFDGSRVAYWVPASDSTADWLLVVAKADLSAPDTLPVRGASGDESIVWHPDGSRVATTSTQFSTPDVVVVVVATGAVQRVTSAPGYESAVQWSPDGAKLSYIRSSSAGSINVDQVTVASGQSRALLPDEMRPYIGAWSPDGKRIAGFIGDGSKYTLWVADSSGSDRRRLSTEGFETTSWRPWSPDGRQLLYESRRTGTSDLWIAPVDGSAPRQLTSNVRNDSEGAWSPDGKWIAFLSDRGRQTDVWVMPATGGEARRVTNSAAEEIGPVEWRPGTNELTFSIRNDRTALWAIDVETGRERQLTADSVRLREFWLSPDTTRATVVVERGGGVTDLGVVSLTDGTMRTLVSGPASVLQPMPSPDGSRIAYISDVAGSNDVWIVDVGSGQTRQLTTWSGYERTAAWSEDGGTIVFVTDRESRLGDIWAVAAAGGTPVRVTRDGGVLELNARAGMPGTYVTRVGRKGGQYELSRLRDDGIVNPVWDRSNVVTAVPYSRDSVIALIAQPDGSMRGMLLSASGGGGRRLLKPNQQPMGASADGARVVYSIPVNGANDLGVLTIANGTERRLTTTPENETGAEFTRDGLRVIFLRQRRVQRIHVVDATPLLAPRPVARTP